MTDPDTTDDMEFDPNVAEYAQPVRPYEEFPSPDRVSRLLEYQRCNQLIEQGVHDAEVGEIEQISGAYRIWKYQLWKEAVSNITGNRFRTQNEWIVECIAAHSIKVFSRTNFFELMAAVEKGLVLGLNEEEAFRLGVNHSALEAMEAAGAIKFTLAKERGGRTTYVPTVTPLGHEKLLKGDLKTPTQYVRDLSTMTRQDALTTVYDDVGKVFAFCSEIIPYAGGTPFLEDATGRVFALQVTHVDPTNGSIHSQAKIVFEANESKIVMEAILRRLKGDFRL